jgi:uncharacterized protein
MRRYPPFDARDFSEIRLPRLPRRSGRLLGVIGLLLLLFFVIGPVVNIWSELLWFQALGLESVYLTRLEIQLGLFAGFGLLIFFFLGASWLLALRLRDARSFGVVGIRRRTLRSLPGAASLAGAGLVAIVTGLGVASQWQAAVLFWNGPQTGISDPVFGMDLAFYLFRLPFLETLTGWAQFASLICVLVTAGLFAWRGGDFSLRLPRVGTATVSAQMAILAAISGLAAYWGRYDLLSSHNGYVWGAGYADVYARIPLATLTAALGALLAVALLANLGLRRLWLPVAALAAWIAFALLGAVYAGTVQRLVVQPNEFNLERPFISRELQFTRQAYGLQGVQSTDYAGATKLTPAAVSSDQVTIDNLRLWDYRPLIETYTQLQTIRTYYSFYDIDLDRYQLDNKPVQVEISARELNTDNLPPQSRTWVALKLQYTHGYGVAASPVNKVVGDGLPALVAGDLPPNGDVKVDQPAIYFGETTNSYVLAPSATQEFDYPSSAGDRYTAYKGTHSPRLNGFNRWIWAARTGDLNLLISTQLTPQTEILYRRNLLDRVNAIAPFLSYDSDPYVVVADGKLYWIVDAYTTADSYPYSQAEQPNAANLPFEVNYIRNPVKVVIDPYEGTATYYVIDSSDPILQGYEKAFPSLFTPIAQMPPALRAHIRYPEGLFKIQASVYRAYHITDPQVFYLREDVWALPQEPSTPGQTQSMEPYYVELRLPNEATSEYLLILPFTPVSKQNMISWLAARNDGSGYGQLVLYRLPESTAILGPQQVGNLIQENTAISSQFTLWNQSGSQVLQGNLLAVPVGGSFLYFEPVYLRASSTSSFPQFKKVILADSSTVVWDDTLAGALNQLLGGQAPPTAGGGGPPPPPNAACDVASLVAQANQHYSAAQDRLKAGDLAGYASEINQVGQLLQQANACEGQAPAASPSPKVSPKPTPTR